MFQNGANRQTYNIGKGKEALDQSCSVDVKNGRCCNSVFAKRIGSDKLRQKMTRFDLIVFYFYWSYLYGGRRQWWTIFLNEKIQKTYAWGYKNTKQLSKEVFNSAEFLRVMWRFHKNIDEEKEYLHQIKKMTPCPIRQHCCLWQFFGDIVDWTTLFLVVNLRVLRSIDTSLRAELLLFDEWSLTRTTSDDIFSYRFFSFEFWIIRSLSLVRVMKVGLSNRLQPYT